MALQVILQKYLELFNNYTGSEIKLKKIKILIIIILLVILILMSTLLYIKYNKKNLDGNEVQIATSEYKDKTITILDNRNMFFTVSSCVDRYIEYIVKKNNISLYSILDDKYITENNITKQNIWNYVDKFSNKQIFSAKEIYKMEDDDYNNTFFVYGTIREEKENVMTPKKDLHIVVKLNYENDTFSIIPFENIPKEAIIKK